MSASGGTEKSDQTPRGSWSAIGDRLRPLGSLLKSPVLWIVSAFALYQPRDVAGFFFPLTIWGALACVMLAGGWVWSGMRWGRRWYTDVTFIFLLFVVGCLQFGLLLRSKEVSYVLPVSQSPLLAAAGVTQYDFFGRNVRLLPVPDRLKQRWAATHARSSNTTIYLTESVDARETIYSHPVETALAQANDPSKDLLWKVIEIPRLVRTRAGEIDVSTRPARMLVKPEVTLRPLKLWSPAHDFRSGLFATKQGNLGVAELSRRIVFQFELFSALGSLPVDGIVAGVEQEARRQGSEEMMAQAVAVRLLLINNLANGDFYAPDLMFELKRALRLVQDQDWSSRHAWFPTLAAAMRDADANLRRSGTAMGAALRAPAAPLNGGNLSPSAAIAQLQPAWLEADSAANARRVRAAARFMANEQRKPSTVFKQIDALLRARTESEFGDKRFARSLWLLPPGRFESAINAWLAGDESKRLYRLLLLRNLGEERLGLMFSALLASSQSPPEALAETRAMVAKLKSQQEFIYALLPVSVGALYAKDANGAALISKYQGMLDLAYCLVSFSDQQCASLAKSTMFALTTFTVGRERSTFEYSYRLAMEEDFDHDLLIRSLIRDLVAPAARHSLESIDRIFAIYYLRIVHDEDPDLASRKLFGEACESAAKLSNRMLNEDELLAEASTHLAFLALEGVCAGIDVRSHQQFLDDLMAE